MDGSAEKHPTVGPSQGDAERMRSRLFYEGAESRTRLSRFALLLGLSGVIASAGVIAESTATVIGAMIVAPLMVPILGIVLSIVLADRDNLLRSCGLVVGGSLGVVAVGWLIGQGFHLPVLASNNTEVAARVAPRLIDLVAALATGAVGSIALAREDISDTLPGVAIAISLVPPLVVIGLTLESGAPDQALGALLLFATNVTAILASGLVVMAIFRVHRTAGLQIGLHRARAAAVVAVGLLVIAVPLGLTSAQIARTTTAEAEVNRSATEWAEDADWDVVSVTTRNDGVLVRVTGPRPEPDVDELRRSIDDADLGGTEVRVELIASESATIRTDD